MLLEQEKYIFLNMINMFNFVILGVVANLNTCAISIILLLFFFKIYIMYIKYRYKRG